ncbi:hypothetical protein AK812_SmicGene1937 [Symbiodinium microadriaticum]|uniref:Threonylcarbamoyl-AMP synthase C-terminal domain-containing protein n=1 Tax=Symbiodinium microadriaticum TaxID=2951 RepID=A0A1Q9F2T2_SYMMI|nr:hypothetical protein AK812_SmicGene1937 [Symbiodinium microadriaticum]
MVWTGPAVGHCRLEMNALANSDYGKNLQYLLPEAQVHVKEPWLESYLAECFQRGELQESISVVSIARKPRSDPVVKPDDEAQMAPGMLLKHYAPSVHTVLLSPSSSYDGGVEIPSPPHRSVLIDFGGRQADHHGLFLKVYELCEKDGTAGKGTAEDACRHVFATLRAAEAYAIAEKVELICVADFDPEGLGGYAEALHDRLFRSASGKRAVLRKSSVSPDNSFRLWSIG